MTDTDPSPTTPAPPGKVNRDARFMIRFSRAEKDRLDAEARTSGFDTVSEYIRDRLFRQPSGDDIRDQQRAGGDLFTDKQKGELAVAVLHQYSIHEAAFGQSGGKEAFDQERRRLIDDLGLRQLLGSGT